MARRPFDPEAHGWRKVEYHRGDVLDRAAVDALVDGRRRRRPPGVRDRRRRRQSRGERRRLAQRLRGRRRGGREAPRLHLVGRGVRVRRRARLGRRAADRGRAGARRRPPSVLGAEGRGRGACWTSALARSKTAAYVFRPCIVAGPQAHDPRRLAADRPPAAAGSRTRCARSSTRCRCSSRCCPTPACRCSSSTTTTSPRRSAARCSAAASPASTTSPARATITLADLAREIGWYSVPVPDLARRRDRRGRRAAAVPARHGELDRGAAPAGPDGHERGRAASCTGRPRTTPPRRCTTMVAAHRDDLEAVTQRGA